MRELLVSFISFYFIFGFLPLLLSRFFIIMRARVKERSLPRFRAKKKEEEKQNNISQKEEDDDDDHSFLRFILLVRGRNFVRFLFNIKRKKKEKSMLFYSTETFSKLLTKILTDYLLKLLAEYTIKL